MSAPVGPPVDDAADWRRSIAADGPLREFNDAGVLESSDVLVARRLTELAGADDPQVALAIALVVRALRGGSVCLDLTTVADQVGHPELAWPEPRQWLATQPSPQQRDESIEVIHAPIVARVQREGNLALG